MVALDEKQITQKIQKLKEVLNNADAILIGAGSGFSSSAGLLYTGDRFKTNFKEFIEKYGMEDMYSAGFYPFETLEEKWAYWSRHVYLNRYAFGKTKVYEDLLSCMKGKNYFVLTTNVDHQFWLSGFPNEKIFATQGDYGLFQCEKGCHSKLYDNEEVIKRMVKEQRDCKIPTNLIPKWPICNKNMSLNLRVDDFFVEDTAWHKAAKAYTAFLEENQNKNLVFLELGVGMNTPAIIKYPFWQMTNRWKNTTYISINKGQAWAPDEIEERSICINEDIGKIITILKEKEE